MLPNALKALKEKLERGTAPTREQVALLRELRDLDELLGQLQVDERPQPKKTQEVMERLRKSVITSITFGPRDSCGCCGRPF